MKRVLLDSNIYLNFYRTSDEVLDNIDRFLEVIDDKGFELVLPKIIRDEFEFNKRRVISDFLYEIEQSSRKFQVPVFLQRNADVKSLLGTRKKISEIGKRVAKACKEKIENPRSHINQNLSKLFDVARLVEEQKEQTDRALLRWQRRYPPAAPKRKNKQPSLGDAIVWEMVLASFQDQDLIIVSNDSDYASQENGDNIDEFLEYEWGQVSKAKLSFHVTLGGFINAYSKKKVEKKIIDEERRASFIAPSLISGASGSAVVFPSEGSVQLGALGVQDGLILGTAEQFNPFTSGKTTCPSCGEEYEAGELHVCGPSLTL